MTLASLTVSESWPLGAGPEACSGPRARGPAGQSGDGAGGAGPGPGAGPGAGARRCREGRRRGDSHNHHGDIMIGTVRSGSTAWCDRRLGPPCGAQRLRVTQAQCGRSIFSATLSLSLSHCREDAQAVTSQTVMALRATRAVTSICHRLLSLTQADGGGNRWSYTMLAPCVEGGTQSGARRNDIPRVPGPQRGQMAVPYRGGSQQPPGDPSQCWIQCELISWGNRQVLMTMMELTRAQDWRQDWYETTNAFKIQKYKRLQERIMSPC